MRNRERLNHLLGLAQKESIRIIFSRKKIQKDWAGIYINSPILGSSITLRESMPLDQLVFTLAHELGHHFQDDRSQPELFSPFRVPLPTQKRLDPAEQRADWYGLELITTPEEWQRAEEQFPCDLIHIARIMELPLDAAVAWSRRRRDGGLDGRSGPLQFSDPLWMGIEKDSPGRGGSQHTFSKLLNRRIGNSTVLERCDFYLMRERAATMRGGYGVRFRQIMSETWTAVQKAGGFAFFFGNNET